LALLKGLLIRELKQLLSDETDEATRFITSWKTDNTGTSNNDQITIPTVSSGTYDCTIFWGDGTSDSITTYNDAAWTHTYSTSGTYTVRIQGTFTGFKFNNAGDEEKLLNISQWGPFNSGNQEAVFYGCSNLTVTATDVMDVSGIATFVQFFRNCSSLTTVANMGSWVTSSITGITDIFSGASSFNEPSIVSWDMSSISNIANMFNSASSFNQDISVWDTSSITTMIGTFFAASSFDQNLAAWDVTSLTSAVSMFDGATLSTANYNALLVGWEAQAVNNTVSFHGGNSTYSGADAAEARFNLINDHSWTITDGGSTGAFIISVKTDNAGTSSSTSFSVPTVSSGTYDCFAEWTGSSGDRITTYNDAAWTHDFGSAATYEIELHGTVGGLAFNNGVDKLKLLDVSQWGGVIAGVADGMFYGCSNMTVTATDTLQFPASSTRLNNIFRVCDDITSLPNVGSWDFGTSVNNSFNMFLGCTNLDEASFSSLDVSELPLLINMFKSCSNFNADISGWTINSDVTRVNGMFEGATVFNQDISSWDMTGVEQYHNMFKSAVAFDQDLSSWDVTSATNLTDMFAGATLSTANYDALLTGWYAQGVPSGLTFSGGNSTYSMSAATARYDMVTDDTWTITDGGLDVGTQVAWYDSADLSTITESSGSVSQWDDKSYNGNDLVQGTGSNQPTYDATGLLSQPTITFDGTTDYLQGTTEAQFDLSAFTIFAVCSGTGSYCGKNDPGTITTDVSRRKLQMTNTVFNSGKDGDTVAYATNTASPNIRTWASASASSHKYWLNATKSTSTTTLDLTTYNNVDFSVGAAFSSGAEKLTGDISELIVFNSSLSDSDIASVLSYLNGKWSVY
jgi:surface protein